MTYVGHSVQQTLIRCDFSPAASTGSQFVYTGSFDGSVYIFNVRCHRCFPPWSRCWLLWVPDSLLCAGFRFLAPLLLPCLPRHPLLRVSGAAVPGFLRGRR